MSLVVAGNKILPKRLVVAVKKYLPYGGGGVLDHPSHNEGAINSGHINLRQYCAKFTSGEGN